MNGIAKHIYTSLQHNNVLSVTNSATNNSMAHAYDYDGLYRLTRATGTYAGENNKTASYTLDMAYDNLHNITNKKQHVEQQDIQFNGMLKAGYELAYNYTNNPFQISTLGDENYRTDGDVANNLIEKQHAYEYDANGNLVYVNTAREKKDGTQAAGSTERKLLWDEENRLEAIDENGFVSNYWYDAAGERTVKTSGESEQMFVNGIFSGGNTSTANFTAYVNPYIVVSKGGHYTKHIYIGSQRIVSKLGDLDSYGADPRRIEYAGNNVDGTLVNYKNKYETSQQTIKDRYAIFEVPYLGKDNDDYVNGQGFCCDDTPQGNSTKAAMQNDNPELFQYYYHSDHLGSTSLITNLDGEVIQHVEYVPFGEVFIEERNNTWNTPYLFNAKELDEETGLYCYGARYYDPRVSIWLSADPKQEKYPNISTYAYVLNNPIKYIDPDGKVVKLADNYAGGMANIAKIAATSLGNQILSHLIGRRETYTMNSTFWSSSSSYNPSNRYINYVANSWYSEVPFDGGALNSMIAMGHETFHAFDHSINVFDAAHAAYAKSTVEPRAVSFGNYLRQAYSLSPLRKGYGNIKGNFHQFGGNEKISNFTTLGNNADETSYGFSYTKTTTIVETYKTYAWGRVPDKTRTEISTHYMTVGMDKDNNATYQIYNNEEDYKKATSNW